MWSEDMCEGRGAGRSPTRILCERCSESWYSVLDKGRLADQKEFPWPRLFLPLPRKCVYDAIPNMAFRYNICVFIFPFPRL